MKTNFGPWSIAIQPHSAPQLGTFWKRRLRMLPAVARSRPVKPAVWLGLLLAAAALWAVPTLSVPTLLAQTRPDQPPQPSIPATLPDPGGQNIAPPQPAENPPKKTPAEIPDTTAGELPELSSRNKTPQLPAGLLPSTGNARDGLPFDPVAFMNDYFTLVAKLRTRETELARATRMQKKGFVTPELVETSKAAIDATRRRLEFLRKLVAISHEAAQEELKLLTDQEKGLTALYRKGAVSMKELLEVRRPLLQLKARLKILELLTESMAGTDLKPPPPQSKPTTDDASANRSKTEIEQTVRDLLGLELAPLAEPPDDLARTKFNGGLRVTAVLPLSAADRAGIRTGDILVGLHHWETLDLDDVNFALSHEEAIRDGRLKFYIVRDGGTSFGYLQIPQTEN